MRRRRRRRKEEKRLRIRYVSVERTHPTASAKSGETNNTTHQHTVRTTCITDCNRNHHFTFCRRLCLRRSLSHSHIHALSYLACKLDNARRHQQGRFANMQAILHPPSRHKGHQAVFLGYSLLENCRIGILCENSTENLLVPVGKKGTTLCVWQRQLLSIV